MLFTKALPLALRLTAVSHTAQPSFPVWLEFSFATLIRFTTKIPRTPHENYNK